MATYVMFLGNEAAKNLGRALDHGTWGWKETLLDSRGQIHHDQTGRERVEALHVGDELIIATCVPGSSLRRDFDPHREVAFRRVVTCEVTRGIYRDTSSMWSPAPDPYCERVDLAVTSDVAGLPGSAFSEEVLRRLTDSLNRGATPFPVGGGVPAVTDDVQEDETVDAPPRSKGKATRQSAPPNGTMRDYEKEARRQKDIGDAGEDVVVAYEQKRLRKAGYPGLADKVEHISKDKGDGFGYDVRSFNKDGTERHIEVKATVGGKKTPFPISGAEVRYSEKNPDQFWLYRVFDVEGRPRIYKLRGSVLDHFDLEPTAYLARR